ncbi:uncharacterized protein LOC125683047 [Ostrea edulis]|uniref:uncharacterized protein LOC125683047 n=1 Tax=Ostrea edulis TaxID=37623 RepID=UPI0024AEA44F|nr:uncharacterized protein LOC125683047 [Ostrea edulis]XP_048779705.2 uncharacterized protein LOC125683047 [Ostrea edulis]XP_048779706.2 uncharacterized protein LOC125683047 [Ostrea edulis]
MENKLLSCIILDQDAFYDVRMLAADKRQQDWISEYLEELSTASRAEVLYSRETVVCYNKKQEIAKKLWISDIIMLGSSHDGLYLERPLPLIEDGTYVNDTDVDVVFEFTGVIITESQGEGQGSFFMLENTFPGYVKMRVVNRIEEEDSEEYLLPMALREKLETAINSMKLFMFMQGNTRDGPALHGAIEDELGIHFLDYVVCMSMSSWPSAATEFLSRPRASGWPSSELIQKATKGGCGFVPVGHPFSSEAHLEWRISFAITEKILLLSLTTTQIRSYVFFKAICKLNLFDEDEPCLTSYMLKNVFFWVLENLPLQTWTPDNLFQCIHALVKRLETFLEDGCLPNYFVPHRNMIQHIKLQVILDVRQKLAIMKGDILGVIARHTDSKEIFSVIDLNYSSLCTKLSGTDHENLSLLLSDVYFIVYLTLRLQSLRYLSNLSIPTVMYIKQQRKCSMFQAVPACAARYLINAITHSYNLAFPLLKCKETNSLTLDISCLRRRAVAFIGTEIYKGKIKRVIDDQEFALRKEVTELPEFSELVDWVDLTCRWCGAPPLIDGQSKWIVYDID